ncbi:hypothetical protein BH18THE1_BH18THE1_14860 [soil metagenome]
MIRRTRVISFSLILFIIFAIMLISPSVFAAKPHFSVTPSIAKNSDLSITANYEAKELGKRTANITVNSQSTALIGCVNPGGKLSPSKGVESEQMLSQSIKIKPKDGKIKGSLILGPPKFPSVLEVCPNKNWRTSILSLTFENVAIDIKQRNSEILKFSFGNLSQ